MADKEWSSSSGIGRVTNNSLPLEAACYEMLHMDIRMDLREIGWEVVDWIQLAQDRDQLWKR